MVAARKKDNNCEHGKAVDGNGIDRGSCVPVRFVVAFLAFVGFTFNYMLRVRKAEDRLLCENV